MAEYGGSDMKRVALAFWLSGLFWGTLIGLLLFGCGGLIPIAHAKPTFEHECQHPDGDEDGTPCIWTAPNGLPYFQDSSNYRRDPKFHY